ncbi:IPTL-CTERM sorting domain-containing protein [Halothiobacillus sp.]|uniref:IPTL-CTERM sorting domain-containing protein n=1 Tax=Halothiobacillus sp. TaxID=1891311 RepID=UPI0026029D8A|nr:IPTL-CTERM sorting domain-containing protein [Halothiobacillus sp.]MDD4967334.1 IPTL-CTERM sorting domain-containing protein [Halothiobacillus sp.]
MSKRFILSGIFSLFFVTATAAQAAPIQYVLNIQQASGSLGGTAFGPGATALISINADTANIVATQVAGDPGHCVPADSATISVNGSSPQAITNANFCSTDDGLYMGLTPVATNPSFGDFTVVMDISDTVSGFPGGTWDLASPNNFGPVTHVPDDIGTGGSAAAVTLAVGGTYYMTAPGDALPAGATGSTLQVSPGGAAISSIPTLSTWGLALLALLVTGMAGFGLRTRAAKMG